MYSNKMGFFDSILFIVLSITMLLHQSIFHLPIVAVKDTLFPGDELSHPSTLKSSNGIFTLGFFKVSDAESSYINLTYLGIWYSTEDTVWVANRDVPIRGDVAILTIDDSGTLRVMNRSSGATLFNVSDGKVGGLGNNNKNNTRGKLQDSGNFIVYVIVTNRTIWESFDHPTDTLIPGMKLGYNLTAKKNWELTSAANEQVPTSGAFTMRLKQYQNTPQLLIYRHGDLYWASGPWNHTTRTFQWLLKYDHVFELTYDRSGMYLFVQMIRLDTSTTSTMMQLSPTGRFPNGRFPYGTLPDFCYGYGSEENEGCVGTLPQCRVLASVNGDVYRWEYGNSNAINSKSKIDKNASLSIGDCMERCWNDCNCIATISTDIDNGTGCIYGTEWNHEEINGQVYNLVSDKSKSNSNVSPKKSKWILLSISIVPVLVLASVMIRIRIIKGKKNRRRDDIIHQLIGSNSFNYGDELERGIQEAPDVKIFSLKAILTATNNFSSENKLGQGGYGPVYKGELSDSRKIAVKRLSKTSGQGILEFQSELILISKLQHKNLVRLYGCCIHQEERMLIYEFMPNKSLDFFIFDDDNKAKIDWQSRFKIIEGVAHGLLYLHKYSRMKVIHRDLKVSNILLDENMNPKIADFGMARIFQHDMSVLMTNRVAGTYGYMAPEYVIHGTFSIKSDVFSFGVLILEIVSSKKNSSFHSLLRYAWELWKREATLEMKDEALGECFDVNQLLKAIHVGLLCVQEHAIDRPTMSRVISMLNNEIMDLPLPMQPVFFMHSDEVETLSSTEHLLSNNIREL